MATKIFNTGLYVEGSVTTPNVLFPGVVDTDGLVFSRPGTNSDTISLLAPSYWTEGGGDVINYIPSYYEGITRTLATSINYTNFADDFGDIALTAADIGALDSSTTLFIRNQSASAQTADSWITGYQVAESGFFAGTASYSANSAFSAIKSINGNYGIYISNSNTGTSARSSVGTGNISIAQYGNNYTPGVGEQYILAGDRILSSVGINAGSLKILNSTSGSPNTPARGSNIIGISNWVNEDPEDAPVIPDLTIHACGDVSIRNLRSASNGSRTTGMTKTLVVDEDGIISSKDTTYGSNFSGEKWDISHPSTSTSNYAATPAYGNGRFIIIPYSTSTGHCLVSTDGGRNWTDNTIHNTKGVTSIAYGAGKFVYVTASGTTTSNSVGTSTDGITWTYRTIPTLGQWSSVCYGDVYGIGGRFVAVSNDNTDTYSVMYSSDGITWINPAVFSGFTFHDVAFVNFSTNPSGIPASSYFVAVGDNGTTIKMSVDGSFAWYNQTVPNNIYRAIAGGNGRAVVVGDGDKCIVSTNGMTWTEYTLPAAGTGRAWARIAYGNGYFVVTTDANSGSDTTDPNFIISKDGITWETVDAYVPEDARYNWAGITFGGGIFMAVAEDGGGEGPLIATSWRDKTVSIDDAARIGNVSSVAIEVPDDAYDSTGWNGNFEVPTKNSIRDILEVIAPDPDDFIQNQTSLTQTGGFKISGQGTAFNYWSTIGTTGGGGYGHYNMSLSSGDLRWNMGLRGATSSGNAGANLCFATYDDSNVFLSFPLEIIRSTGQVRIASLDTSGSAPGTSGTTKMVICDDNGGLSFDDIPSGGGSAITPYAETPSGTINGVNTTFTLANTPVADEAVILIVDGIPRYLGIDFTMSGSTISMTWAPTTGSNIFAYYNSPATTPATYSTVVQTITADTVATDSLARKRVILVNAASTTISLDLPTAVGNKTEYVIKKKDSSTNAVTIIPNGSETIDGGATAVLAVQHESISIVSDNSNWYII